MARWLAVAVVASVGFALCVKLELLVGQATDRILSSPFDPTCGGGCTRVVVVNQLVLPVALALVFGALGGIVGGSLQFAWALSHGADSQADREDLAADASVGGERAAIPQPSEHIRSRTLPGGAYWGPILLGILACGGWLLALYLSLNMPLAPYLWRILAQIALLLLLPAAIILYSARRRTGVLLPRRAVYALLAVVLDAAAMLPGLILLARLNAGLSLLVPLFAPLFLPLFVPALSTGVAVGFAWGVRRPGARPGGVAAALCAWVGFTLPLTGLMALEVVALRSHSSTCSGYGCMLAGAIILATFELAGTVILFALVLLLAGFALGRTFARRLPPAVPRPATTAQASGA